MNLALNTVLARLRGGGLARLEELDRRTFTPVHPAQLFPRIGQLRLGGVPAVQHSPTTCGTTVLALVNAMFDPALLTHLRGDDVDVRTGQARERFADLQQRLLARATGRTWPESLGTPPWGLARELRVPGVTYEHLAVDDRNHAMTEVLGGVLRRATAAGIPVPLYVGGSLRDRAAAAVPRHVVLLVPPAAMTFHPVNTHVRIYEPASGRVYRRAWSALWDRRTKDAALGGWTHISWAVLPKQR